MLHNIINLSIKYDGTWLQKEYTFINYKIYNPSIDVR